jgi:hypothetical protein
MKTFGSQAGNMAVVECGAAGCFEFGALLGLECGVLDVECGYYDYDQNGFPCGDRSSPFSNMNTVRPIRVGNY